MNGSRSLGVTAAIGLVIQIALGLLLARLGAPFPPLVIGVHMAIGVTGVALVAFLLGRAYYSSSNAVKLLYILAFVLVLAQLALGFRILTVSDDQLAMSHEGIAVVILVLLAVTTVVDARQKRAMTAPTGTPAPQP